MATQAGSTFVSEIMIDISYHEYFNDEPKVLDHGELEESAPDRFQ